MDKWICWCSIKFLRKICFELMTSMVTPFYMPIPGTFWFEDFLLLLVYIKKKNCKCCCRLLANSYFPLFEVGWLRSSPKLSLCRSSKNSRVVRVSLHDENALTRSFDELHMFSPSSNRKIFPTRKLQVKHCVLESGGFEWLSAFPGVITVLVFSKKQKRHRPVG